MKPEELKLLIAEGEGLTVEFKERFSSRMLEDMVAFANARGGRILLGVSDEGMVKGERLTNSLKSQIVSLARNCDPAISVSVKQAGSVVAVVVAEGADKPYACSAGYFRRLDAVTQKMTQKEIKTVFRETVDRLFEDLPRKDCRPEDISIKKIQAFLDEAHTSFHMNKRNLTSFLTSLGIYKEGKINNAGVLMFARDTSQFIPHAEVICGAFKGADRGFIYDRKDVRSDLLTQLNESMAFIQRQLNVRSEIRGINRYDICELPLDALREAVVNAIIHRDYSVRGTNIYVAVYDDRVEIENPGGFPAGVTRANFGKTSIRRNPIIADLFHRMGKVERMGSGIRKMNSLMENAGLKHPVFEADTFFRATFYRDPEYSLKKVPEKVPERLGQSVEKGHEKSNEESKGKGHEKSKEKIIRLMLQSPGITTQALSVASGLSIGGVEKTIRTLKKDKLIRRVGPDKGGHWEVRKTGDRVKGTGERREMRDER